MVVWYLTYTCAVRMLRRVTCSESKMSESKLPWEQIVKGQFVRGQNVLRAKCREQNVREQNAESKRPYRVGRTFLAAQKRTFLDTFLYKNVRRKNSKNVRFCKMVRFCSFWLRFYTKFIETNIKNVKFWVNLLHID